MGKTLIAFYSYTGNTRKLASQIHKTIGGDIVEIETVKPYEGDYNSVVNQGQDEVNSGYKPAIRPLSVQLDKYDTIVLGTPVWWYTVAPAVLTFLTDNNFVGKKIIPFATNGGWIGHTFTDIKELCPDSEVKNEINIKFSGDKLSTSMKEIDKWMDDIK